MYAYLKAPLPTVSGLRFCINLVASESRVSSDLVNIELSGNFDAREKVREFLKQEKSGNVFVRPKCKSISYINAKIAEYPGLLPLDLHQGAALDQLVIATYDPIA